MVASPGPPWRCMPIHRISTGSSPSAGAGAANADTWATKLATFLADRLITSGERVPGPHFRRRERPAARLAHGRSAHRVTGSWLFGIPSILLAGTLAGVFGSLVDSLLGACCQAVYYCPACQVEQSARQNMGVAQQATHHIRLVNLIATLSLHG